jgi:tetratricopeptide (TPR) repeat protein
MNLETTLAQLEQAQLVRPLMGDDLAYIFKHVLTQEAAYQSLLVKRRRELHRQVAIYYEGFCSGDLDEVAELLAYHYSQAGDDAKTLTYATLAGDVALRRYATTEAIAHYAQALEIAQRMEAGSEQLLHLYTCRGRAFELSGHYTQALANYAEMETKAGQRGDSALGLAAVMARATLYATPTASFNPAQAQALADHALALARTLGDRRAEAKTLWLLLLINFNTGHPREAVVYGERSLAIARELGLHEQLAFTLNDITYAYLIVSDQVERALEALNEAHALWQAQGNLAMLAGSLASLSEFYQLVGDYEQALALSEEAYNIGQSIGNLWDQSYSRMMVGNIYLDRGQVDHAMAIMEESIRLGEQASFIVAPIAAGATLARTYGLLGAPERGLDLARRALAKAEAQFPLWEPLVAAILAQLYLLLGDDHEAEIALKQAYVRFTPGPLYSPVPLADAELGLARREYARVIALMDEHIAFLRQAGLHAYLADALYLQGQALLAQGQTDRALDVLVEARAEAEALGARRILWRILFALGQIEAGRGHAAEAQALREQARTTVEAIANHIGAAELRTSFLNQPPVQAVLSAGLTTRDEGQTAPQPGPPPQGEREDGGQRTSDDR